jgi:nitrogen regulatory protein PII
MLVFNGCKHRQKPSNVQRLKYVYSNSVKGRGRSKQESVDVERGTRSYIPELGPRTKIEVIVENTVAKRIVDDVLSVVSTGSSYDGKIFVSDALHLNQLSERFTHKGYNLVSHC